MTTPAQTTDLQSIVSRLQADLQTLLSRIGTDPANPQGTMQGSNPAPASLTPTPAQPAAASPTPTEPAAANSTPAQPAAASSPLTSAPLDINALNQIVKGGEGNDSITADGKSPRLFGNAGDDQIVGADNAENIRGGLGNDTLIGNGGDDVLIGGPGTDQLTGGSGRDIFAYNGDVFADGTPTPAGQTGINVLNKPDVISDFTIGEDKFGLNKFDLNLQDLKFQKGKSSDIAGDSNVIVLTDPFPAAGAAAKAIANNDKITADEGVFVYFNSTLGLTRLAYSQDLGDGGDVSVLANLDNQKGAVGLANLDKFSANDFTVL